MAVPKDLNGELYWLNYYVDGEFVLEFEQRDPFHKWVIDTVNEVRFDALLPVALVS